MTTSDSIIEQARALIGATGHRVTKPRLDTLTVLLDRNSALSHGDLREIMPEMDRVSLYRTLEWLLEQNLAFRIDTDGHHRYSAHAEEKSHHQHPHFCCNNCGLTTCLSDVFKSAAIKIPSGFKITDVELLVKGLCKACVKSSK